MRLTFGLLFVGVASGVLVGLITGKFLNVLAALGGVYLFLKCIEAINK